MILLSDLWQNTDINPRCWVLYECVVRGSLCPFRSPLDQVSISRNKLAMKSARTPDFAAAAAFLKYTSNKPLQDPLHHLAISGRGWPQATFQGFLGCNGPEGLTLGTCGEKGWCLS